MFLGLKTDTPLAEFFLYDTSGNEVAHETWQADRQLAHGLLGKLETFLKNNSLGFNDLTGLFVFQGPGSFTGLRIGMTVLNTMAYALSVPIVAEGDEDWVKFAVKRLIAGETDELALPEYGAPPRITMPKK